MSLFKKKVTKDCATCRGFTLVELMIVIAILAIAMAIAAPDINAWRANAKLGAAARDVVSTFQLAKMEAAKRNEICTITFNVPVGGVTFDCFIYVDTNQNLEFDGGDQRLRAIIFSDYEGVNLVGVAFPNNDNGRPSVAFNSIGLPIDNNDNPGPGSVTLSNNNGRQKTINVSAAGSVSIP